MGRFSPESRDRVPQPSIYSIRWYQPQEAALDNLTDAFVDRDGRKVIFRKPGKYLMRHLQKLGGIAALYAGGAYIVGMLGFMLIVGWPEDPVEQVHVLVHHQTSLHILYLIVYQLWAVFLVILTLSLHERFKPMALASMQITTAIGIIWATVVIASGMIFNIGMANVIDLYHKNPDQATTVWIVLESVCNGLGGGNEILGGLWMLLISRIALQSGELPRTLSFLGLGVGAAGVFSALPGLSKVGLLFGLLQIVWFIWLGLIILRDRQSQENPHDMASDL